MAPQHLHNFRQNRAYVATFITHHGQTQDGKLTMILCLHLCYRDVVTVPQSILNAAHYLSFILEAPGFSHQQSNAEGTDNHVLQRSLHLVDAVGLDQVANLDIVVPGDLQAALETLANIADIVFEALERLEARCAIWGWVDDHAVANHLDLGR